MQLDGCDVYRKNEKVLKGVVAIFSEVPDFSFYDLCQ
jgi:hypothetical protein